MRALDGLSLGGKQLVTAEENGVGKAIAAPLGKGFLCVSSLALRAETAVPDSFLLSCSRGVSVAFRTGAAHGACSFLCPSRVHLC